MKAVLSGSALVFLLAFAPETRASRAPHQEALQEVQGLLADLHRAASVANGPEYLRHFAGDAVVMGTARGERWSFDEYRERVSSAFARGRRRHSMLLEQNVMASEDGLTAWFDERVRRDEVVEMRYSGVLRRRHGSWKIVQLNHVLPVPNELVMELAPRLSSGSQAATAPGSSGDPTAIAALLDFHQAADQASFEEYFQRLSEDAVFLGTDASERFPVIRYRELLRPVFASGRGPRSVPVEQHVQVSEDGQVAWFDEVLVKPDLGTVRGSGLLRKEEGTWRIVHYNMAFLVPNEVLPELIDGVSEGDPGGFTSNRSVAELRRDFMLLRETLESWHPALHVYESKVVMDQLFDQTLVGIREPMTPLEFERRITPLLARVHCVHTKILPTLAHHTARQRAATYLPVRVRVIGDRLFLGAMGSGDPRLIPGAELHAINGEVSTRILERLRSVISADGTIESHKQRVLDDQFVELYSIHIDRPTRFTLQVRSPGSEQSQAIEVPALTWNQWRGTDFTGGSLGPDAAIQTEFLAEEDAAVLRVHTFRPSHPLEFLKAMDEFFQELRERGTGHLILDLRHNSGGDPEMGARLVSYLADERFVYFRTSRTGLNPLEALGLAPYLVPRDASPHAFTGQLYVLIGGRCTSTTGHVLSLIKHHELGVFLGEESGATWSCNDNSRDLVLPSTGIQVHIARDTFETAVEGLPRGRGIQPDHPVAPTIEDLLAARDVVMERALELIRASRE